MFCQRHLYTVLQWCLLRLACYPVSLSFTNTVQKEVSLSLTAPVVSAAANSNVLQSVWAFGELNEHNKLTNAKKGNICTLIFITHQKHTTLHSVQVQVSIFYWTKTSFMISVTHRKTRRMNPLISWKCSGRTVNHLWTGASNWTLLGRLLKRHRPFIFLGILIFGELTWLANTGKVQLRLHFLSLLLSRERAH